MSVNMKIHDMGNKSKFGYWHYLIISMTQIEVDYLARIYEMFFLRVFANNSFVLLRKTKTISSRRQTPQWCGKLYSGEKRKYDSIVVVQSLFVGMYCDNTTTLLRTMISTIHG